MTQCPEQHVNTSLGIVNKLIVDFSKLSPEGERAYAKSFCDLLRNGYKGLELQYRICLKALECLSAYAYQPLPSKPFSLRKREESDEVSIGDQKFKKSELLKTLTKEERKAFEDKEKRALVNNSEYVAWRKECDKVSSENYSNALWLEHMIDTMELAKDEAYINEVIKTYNTYPERMENWKKKIYATKTFDQDTPTESVGDMPGVRYPASEWPV